MFEIVEISNLHTISLLLKGFAKAGAIKAVDLTMTRIFLGQPAKHVVNHIMDKPCTRIHHGQIEFIYTLKARILLIKSNLFNHTWLSHM